MTRRRSVPWIQRWSRPITAALATIGAIGTGYLTISKLTSSAVLCKADCDVVLNSEYAKLFGLPLSLFGCLAYLTMALLAVAPLLANGDSEERQSLRYKLENWTRLPLFLGGVGMLIFSSYLMYVMSFDIKHLCPYCIGSALISLSFFILGILGHQWEDVGSLVFNGLLVAMGVSVFSLSHHAIASGPTQPLGPDGTPVGGVSPPVVSISTTDALSLAKYLSQQGSKMYGAYWCSHCHEQKELFGKEATLSLPYVECDPQGANSKTADCRAAGVEGYPTWDIKGKKLSGTQPLETLAKESGYTGSMNFGTPKP
jgi:uncharacterized membrane protein